MEFLEKKLEMDFESAVKYVEKRVIEGGFNVMLVKSIDEIIETKMGLNNYPKYSMILACSPEFAKMALDVSKLNGLLFPCSFVVYENEGEIVVGHISIMKISAVIGLTETEEMNEVIEKTGEAVDLIWKTI
ncbi:MAG: hypothetical protein BEU04_01865 [Marine Group III euryarchaeote CG-Bathy1]|uniref:DUF302 domain-containing protein n=1 Tax=Marine Group III euryarchaeote CG-Bathy1 TaxID=1889001 RepID=A0A1J5T4A1_9ARCH|nr:MAG: hypothetical protein BEU04_01865 [Marine Group III euryarchaeote CG-Bathy1]